MFPLGFGHLSKARQKAAEEANRMVEFTVNVLEAQLENVKYPAGGGDLQHDDNDRDDDFIQLFNVRAPGQALGKLPRGGTMAYVVFMFSFIFVGWEVWEKAFR